MAMMEATENAAEPHRFEKPIVSFLDMHLKLRHLGLSRRLTEFCVSGVPTVLYVVTMHTVIITVLSLVHVMFCFQCQNKN